MQIFLKTILTLSCWYSLECFPWVLSYEYPIVSQSFSVFLHSFVSAKLATSSIRVNCNQFFCGSWFSYIMLLVLHGKCWIPFLLLLGYINTWQRFHLVAKITLSLDLLPFPMNFVILNIFILLVYIYILPRKLTSHFVMILHFQDSSSQKSLLSYKK